MSLMEGNKLLEVSHGLDLGGLAGRSTIRWSGDGLGSNSGGGSLNGLFTSRGELGDFASESGNVSLGDRLLLGLESTLDDGLGCLGSSFGGSSRALISLEESVGIESGGLAILETEVGKSGASAKLDNTVSGNVALTRHFGDVREGIGLAGGGDGGDHGIMNVGVDKVLHLVISVDVQRMSVERDGGVVGGLETVDDQLELNTSVRGEDVLGSNLGELEGPVGDENNL